MSSCVNSESFKFLLYGSVSSLCDIINVSSAFIFWGWLCQFMKLLLSCYQEVHGSVIEILMTYNCLSIFCDNLHLSFTCDTPES